MSETSRPPRPCWKPGCGRLTTERNGYCELHQDIASEKAQARIVQWQKSQRGESASQKGYGAAWRKLREAKLRSEPLCTQCGRAATVVHHIDENPYNTSWDNLMSLCRNCHERLHGRKGRDKGKGYAGEYLDGTY